MVHNSLRACEKKVKHKTWRKAMAARASVIQAGKSDQSLQVYFCNHCGRYHLGHPSRWTK